MSMNPGDSPTSSATLRPGDDSSRQRSPFAPAIVIVLCIIVPSMIGWIFWRWATLHNPETAVVVGGDSSVDGAVVVVKGNSSTWTVVLNHANAWQGPVMLEAGQYHVEATHHGRTILSEGFVLERFRGLRFDLPSMVQLIGGPSLAGARIEVATVESPVHSEPREIKLQASQRYRAPVYLFPGSYRVTVKDPAHPEHPLAEADIDVDRSQPIRLDLVRAAAETIQ